jgi:hypothetical protein
MSISIQSILFAGVAASLGFLFVWIKSLQNKARRYENERIKNEAKKKVDEQSLKSLVDNANKRHGSGPRNNN